MTAQLVTEVLIMAIWRRGKVCRTRNEARADRFDYIERFYNAVRRHSTIGCVSPVEFERKVGLAQLRVHRTGSRPRQAPKRSSKHTRVGPQKPNQDGGRRTCT